MRKNNANQMTSFPYVSQVKQDVIDALRFDGSLRQGDYTLRCGRKSNLYVDIKTSLLKPTSAKTIHDAISIKIETSSLPCFTRHSLLVGYGYGGALLCAGYISSNTNSRAAVLRSETKEHGLQGELIGEKPSLGRHIIILEDVVTTGGSVIECLNLLKKSIKEKDLRVGGILTIVDRREDPTQNIEGLPVVSVLTEKDLKE